MHRIRSDRTFAVLVLCLACSRHSASPPPVASLNGSYRFVERVATMNETITGGIVIRSDTLVAVDDAGVCEYDVHASRNDNVIVYHCGAVTLRFDRRDPIGKATFETTASVQSRQVICDNARRGCAAPRVENTTVQRPVTGVLHLKRIEPPG
jgi:hypothetical protein